MSKQDRLVRAPGSLLGLGGDRLAPLLAVEHAESSELVAPGLAVRDAGRRRGGFQRDERDEQQRRHDEHRLLGGRHS